MKDERIAYFNILKVVAAICVSILFHYQDHFLVSVNEGNPFSDNYILYLLSLNSNMFVEMFFIISGLLFKKIYFDRIVNGHSFKEFCVKRVVRLYPVMIITVLFMYVLQVVIIHQTGAGWNEEASISLKALFLDCFFAGPVWINGTMTQNAPIWYINVLLICYLWAFGLTKLLRLLVNKYNVSRLTSCLLFCIPMLLGIFMNCNGFSWILWNRYISRGYISFFVGFFLEILLEEYNSWSKGKKVIIKSLSVLCVFAVLMAYTGGLSGMIIDDLSFVVCAYVFPSVIVALYDIPILNRICNTKIMNYLGNISFGIYIWNFPIFAFLYLLKINDCLPFKPTSVGFIIFNLLIHFFVAILSYELIEKRITNKIIVKLKEKHIW